MTLLLDFRFFFWIETGPNPHFAISPAFPSRIRDPSLVRLWIRIKASLKSAMNGQKVKDEAVKLKIMMRKYAQFLNRLF